MSNPYDELTYGDLLGAWLRKKDEAGQPPYKTESQKLRDRIPLDDEEFRELLDSRGMLYGVDGEGAPWPSYMKLEIIAKDYTCDICGGQLLLFRNSDGPRIRGCPLDDLEDILKWLRCEYPPEAGMKTCPNCGKQVVVLIQDNATGKRFCWHCAE
jgi:hypothetical protein